MVLIRGGTLAMGSPDSDKDAQHDERPQHDVRVATFCLDAMETTVAAYEKCVAKGACKPAPTTVLWAEHGDTEATQRMSKLCNAGKAERASHPINCVDWLAADTYCKAQGQRLPTEEEWEYAARGKTGRAYPWGSSPPDETRLNACGAECKKLAAGLGMTWNTMYPGDDGWASTAPVGSFPKGATPEGVHDLAGNVWEWTSSRHCPYPGNACNQDRRSDRGSGWSSADVTGVRAAHRSKFSPTDRTNDLGFRCALTR